MSNHPSSRRTNPRVKLPLWAVAGLGGLAVILLLIVVWITGSWLFTTVQEAVASWTVTDDPFVLPEGEGGQASGGLGSPLVSSDSPTAGDEEQLSPQVLQPWSGTERINILLLGIDLRCGEEGPTHTDSMMVVTIDPIGKSIAALSLPRDMWIEIPGFGVNRINQAYFQGEAYEYPGGGAALAVETVEATLGIPVQYYAAINFDGFVEIIDLIDGITIEASEEIDDPTYPDSCYGYDPFHIDPGTHELDGMQALKYARTRATANGDIDRAARQQQVLSAARKKVLSLNMAPRLLTQAPQLWRSLQDNTKTNMTLEEAVQLALLVQDIEGDVQTYVLDYTYVYNEVTPDGQMVLVPNRDRIRGLRDQIFAPPAIPTPVIENLPQLARQENARVVVHNGTTSFGLASTTRDYLLPYGINVVDIGNADEATLTSTQIVDYGSHLNTTRYLAELLGVPPLNITYSTRAPAGDYDVLIVLGNDQQPDDAEEPSP